MSPDDARALFAYKLSKMYEQADPQYKKMISVVRDVNEKYMKTHSDSITDTLDSPLSRQLRSENDDRVTQERHGAIRVATPSELIEVTDFFKVLGMFPVNVYDLTSLKKDPLPIVGTAFRSITKKGLIKAPFRMFTSLLQLDDERFFNKELREKAKTYVKERHIFGKNTRSLIEKHKNKGGLSKKDMNILIEESVESFRLTEQLSEELLKKFKYLHDESNIISKEKLYSIDEELYTELLKNGSDIAADIICFKGTHINHLTPRTYDIDEVYNRLNQEFQMIEKIQGPKPLINNETGENIVLQLRQTSYKAIPIPILFQTKEGKIKLGSHRNPFGEIEQRGIALTEKGVLLLINNGIRAFPTTHKEIALQQLGYYEYSLTDKGKQLDKKLLPSELDELIRQNYVQVHPITYEDFLAVSAAEIFKSNLSDNINKIEKQQKCNNHVQKFIKIFENNGIPIINSYTLYQTQQAQSTEKIYKLNIT
uniref:2-oxoadipate dioxygenase/decarboxylase n=1 Tax=Mimivirus LCMiAC02 TaxID=2506609 RepID=A0A481Z0Y5_9VIRU|nr:MAG: uncharacterized protein LCMiAC02_01720 [Mimivirus LCMiAC02]